MTAWVLALAPVWVQVMAPASALEVEEQAQEEVAQAQEEVAQAQEGEAQALERGAQGQGEEVGKEEMEAGVLPAEEMKEPVQEEESHRGIL